jgi:hypothetical protein
MTIGEKSTHAGATARFSGQMRQFGMSQESKEIRLTCPHCGQRLVRPAGKTELAADDLLSCPTHGEIGRSEDIIKDTAIGAIGDQVEGATKTSGPITKE